MASNSNEINNATELENNIFTHKPDWSSLPQEIWEMILPYLKVEDKKKIRLMSKSMLQVVDRSGGVRFAMELKNKTFRSYIEFAKRGECKSMSLIVWYLTAKNGLVLQPVLFQNVKKLVLKQQIAFKSLVPILGHCSQSAELSIHQYSLEKVFDERFNKMINELSKWTLLKELCVSLDSSIMGPNSDGPTTQHSRALAHFLNNAFFPKLNKFEVVFGKDIIEPGMLINQVWGPISGFVVKHASILKTLVLLYAPWTLAVLGTEEALPDGNAMVTNMESVDFRIETLNVNLMHTTSENDGLIKFIGQLKTLKSLEIETKNNNLLLDILRGNCNTLQRLKVKSGDNVDWLTIENNFPVLRALKEFDLSFETEHTIVPNIYPRGHLYFPVLKKVTLREVSSRVQYSMIQADLIKEYPSITEASVTSCFPKDVHYIHTFLTETNVVLLRFGSLQLYSELLIAQYCNDTVGLEYKFDDEMKFTILVDRKVFNGESNKESQTRLVGTPTDCNCEGICTIHYLVENNL